MDTSGNLRDIAKPSVIISLQNQLLQEILDRIGGDENLQQQIDSINSIASIRGSVDTRAELAGLAGINPGDAYIVLGDETHDGVSTIYVFDGSDWVFAGEFKVDMGDFYTKSEVNQLIDASTTIVDGTTGYEYQIYVDDGDVFLKHIV